MTAERFVNGTLTIDLKCENGEVLVVWTGRSMAREPGAFILPILMRAMELSQQQNQRAVFDFRSLDYLNSSTITPVIRVLEQAKRGTAQVTVRYRTALKWQALAFSALYLFGTADGRVAIQGT